MCRAGRTTSGSPAPPAASGCRMNSLDVRPSRMATTRPTDCATARSWVTMTTVTPSSRFTSRKVASRWRAVCESTLPVGSSASSSGGSLASATAIATRCCSPPESSVSRLPARWSTPTCRSNSSARCRRPRRRRASSIGTSTFSAAVRYGTRLRALFCQTKPTVSRR